MGYLFIVEWIFWGLANVATAAAYLALPGRLRRARKVAETGRQALSDRNSRLFGRFVLECAIAHVLMFSLMIVMAAMMEARLGAYWCSQARIERGLPEFIFVFIVIFQAWRTALVSWMAVLKLKLIV